MSATPPSPTELPKVLEQLKEIKSEAGSCAISPSPFCRCCCNQPHHRRHRRGQILRVALSPCPAQRAFADHRLLRLSALAAAVLPPVLANAALFVLAAIVPLQRRVAKRLAVSRRMPARISATCLFCIGWSAGTLGHAILADADYLGMPDCLAAGDFALAANGDIAISQR